MPLPDVVYNRLPNRRAETTTSIQMLRERFVRRNIPFFQLSFFKKSDINELLENDLDANLHVPESVMNPTQDTIRDMLTRHQFVYYKPTSGSLGIGIYRLTYLPRKGYFARYTVNGKTRCSAFKQFSSLMRMLQGRHGRSLRNYVVQQEFGSSRIDGCPIDFRFHMHKNGENDWTVVGIGAKKAGKGSVTTHSEEWRSVDDAGRSFKRMFAT